MRSYILAIAVSMLLAAAYAFQNTSEITVRFFAFQRAFPQGVWEIVLFSIGALLMWFFSILASIETHTTHRSQVKERDKKIAELEAEKSSLLNAFRHLPQADASKAEPEGVVHAVPVEAAAERIDDAPSEPSGGAAVGATGTEADRADEEGTEEEEKGSDFI